jgi:hypothetical protein
MNFARAVDRVQRDFVEIPGLELTIGQAVRLWQLGADDCRSVLDSLVDAGLLRWTARRTIARADKPLHDEGAFEMSYVSVRRAAAR